MIVSPKLITGEQNDGKVLDRPAYSQALKDAGVTHEEAKAYWSNVANTDPYSQAFAELNKAVASQAPKVSIVDDKISISAPKTVLESPITKQIQDELKSLKGVDLKNPEVINAIDALNKEIQTNYSDSMIEQAFGWTPEEFKDYQYSIQTIGGTNPMQSQNKIKGTDKDGGIVMKTPKEWVDYWRSVYNTKERTDALYKSAQSNNPYERTMALVLMQGHETPVYGFDAGERLQQGLKAFGNQMLKLPEGLLRLLFTDNNTRRVESFSKDLNIPSESLQNFEISDESKFSSAKDAIKGKSWNQLSDEEKALLVEIGVSKENSMLRESDRDLLKNYSADNLKNMSSDDENVSKEAIKNILDGSSFDKYKETRDNYSTWQGYDKETSRDEEELAKTALWSSGSQNIGNITGVIGRFLWEAALMKAATGGLTGGGFNVNAISDKIGEKIVGSLAKHGVSPVSSLGKNTLQFAANLVGTIPEDIVQTSVDNVLTYNIDDNENLLNPEEMSENFKNNLIFMSLFNAARAGISSLKRAKMVRELAKRADLSQGVNIEGIASDADDLARAVKNGQQIKVDNEVVSIVDNDGKEIKLNNVSPEQVKMAQPSLFDLDKENYSRIGVAQQRNDISAIPEELQSAWYENGDRAARESMADIIESNPAVRNASLNKFYEDYLYWQRALDHQPLPFDEWLDSDIVLYRYSDPNMDSGSKTLSYSVAPGGLPLMGGDIQAIVIKPKDTLGKAQLTGTAAENEVFVRSDIANKKSPGVGTYEYAVIEDNVLKNKDSSSTAAKRAMTTREIDVWSSKNLKDGDKVYTSSSEADTDFGHNNVAKHTIRLSDAEWDDINHGEYKAQSDIEVGPIAKVNIEVDTPNGRVLAEAPDYRPRNFDEAVKLKVEPTAPAVLHGQNVKLDTVMDSFRNDFLPEFRNKFGNVESSDFDWVFHNSRNGLTPEQIIGTVNPETNKVVTKEMIDAMKWWADSPYTKDLRMASRNALGMEGDFNILGYLPHTDYDPTNMSFEEALTGRLWQQYTGASMSDELGNYKGFGGDLQSRYRTFASNMLWDSMNNEVAAAKLMEEAQMDGVDLAPEQAVKAVEGEKNIRQKVADAPSSKELAKALSSDSDDIDWNKIDDNIKKQAETSGLGKAIHDNYQDVYYGANGSAVGKQGNAVVNSFDTLGNRMRNTTIGNGMSMYDWGGADLVYAPKNAAELVARYMNEGGDFRDMLIEYIESHSHRSPQYAESVADKWMAKLGEIPGELNKGKVIYSLSNSMKWEAMTRLKKWLTMANYDQFNDSTKKMIDRFLFNHMQMDSIKNNPTIGQKLTKALDTLTGLRYRALFYGNIKNALLQTSELNRYFSSFKWGDVAQMAKRLATDENFRARVDTYVDAVAPSTSYLDAELYGKFSNVADSMEVEENGVKFKDLGKKTKETADAIGLGPIEAAESFKNRMMVAGLVQEADRLGLTGDEALRHIRKRFERVGLAADEMGRIGMSSNPLAKTMLFLQNFQIRELGMHLYNIMDEWKLGNSVPKKVLNATKYLTKVFGSKLATTLILARLGYSASQTMGLDPFGLLDNYTGMDEDDMEWVDKQIAGGMLTPFFSGGMTSLLADMYFMARKAYEESSQQTVSDEAEQKLESSWGLAVPNITFDQAMEGARNFIPGNVFVNRISQMNDMLDTGWATSASGNKMYTAPTDPIDTILGYLFGRSATQNALRYNQTYGDNLLQTLGRFMPGRQWGEFDPIDTKNYSDWFRGDGNDLQQFNKGRYWFQNEKNRILREYQSVIENSYATSEEISEAQNNMNRKLDELYDQLEKFVAAYEKKNGTISANMVKQILSILNTGKNVVGETQEQRDARQLEDYNKALERYSQLGLSPVGTYTGPTEANPDKETKYQGSPQYRASASGYYDNMDEAVKVLKLADETLAPVRKALQSRLSYAYSTEDWGTVESLQNEYLKQFDQVVAPIIATYGNGILSSTDVVNQLNDMLSTGTNKRSGNLIPSSMYAKNKRGRYQSMPLERVDVGKWAMQRYSGNLYTRPTVRSYSTAEEDLEAIKKLSAAGQPGRARARALQLKVRVDNQERSLSKADYKWLTDFLSNKGAQ